jgi:hypothetical protein
MAYFGIVFVEVVWETRTEAGDDVDVWKCGRSRKVVHVAGLSRNELSHNELSGV